MKNYKDYTKAYIGSSDRCFLIVLGGDLNGGIKSELLKFGGDGAYSAYIVDSDTEIPDYYTLQFTFVGYANIYNDENMNMLALSRVLHGSKFEFYRSGNFGCIIKVYSEE